VVSAVNGGGESANSAQVSATPKPSLPGTPLNVTAVGGNARVDLTWGAVAGASTYRVKRATVSGGPYATVVDELTTTSYADANVTSGTTYYYVVSALNAGGESANSTQVAASPTAPLPAAPAAPGSPQATAGNAQVSLTWAASTGATSYVVKRSSTSGSGYSVIASGLTSTSYLDQSVTNGSTYYYVVSAVNSGGESGNSVQVSAIPEPLLPGAPLNVTAMAGNTRVDLAWGAVTDAAAYCVKRATTSGGPYTVVGDQLTANSYSDLAVSNGVTYYYVVIAVNSAGAGAASAQVSALPAAPTVQPVFKATTSAGSASVTPGKATTVATTITCTAAPPATAQVVVQVYNSAGALVGQKVTPNQVFTIGQGRWFGYIWTAPSVSGTYRVRVAVLSADGSKTYYANDSAVSVVVR
jgi:cellulose 1,4-beta-cellobiosidase